MKVIEVLNNKNIEYREANNDYLIRCLNPEHEDSDPSLRVDKVTGVMHCFSCGFAENIFRFFGYIVSTQDVQILQLKAKIRELSKEILTIPMDSEKYLKSFRGISADTLSKFEAFTQNTDFEGRIVFPVRDIQGDITSFIGRYINSDAHPKYLIKPEHSKLSLHPSKPEIIRNSIILVEGIFDMLNLYDKGLTNAVCTFGTAFGSVRKYKRFQKNLEKLNLYKLQGVDTIYIMYDGDKAGRDAATQLEKNLQSHFIVEVVNLPENSDPGSLTQEEVSMIKGTLYE